MTYLILSIDAVIIFLICMPLHIDLRNMKKTLSTVFKCSATLVCASLCAFASDNSLFKWLIFSGLLLCCAADGFLEYKFTPGVLLFASAHICYITAILIHAVPTYYSAIIFALLAILLRFILGKVFLIGKLQVYGICYAVIISVMLSFALPLGFTKAGGTKGLFFALGALLFYISDVLIALGMKDKHSARYETVVLSLYWSGQLFIASSVFI